MTLLAPKRSLLTEPERGLSHQEVERSRRLHGSNALAKKKRRPFLAKYLESFADPIIRILLIALGVNLLFMFMESFHWYEPVGIGIAVLIATLIATLSEYGNESAFARIQEEAALIRCKVRREGVVREVSIEEIVVGDLVLLQAGDRVPADGEMVSGSLDVDQSALNGESREARKSSGGAFKEGDFLDAASLFRGCVVTGGEGYMRAERVGECTVYGSLARDLQADTRESPMRVRLNGLAQQIAKLGYIGSAAVTLSYFLFEIVLENHGDVGLILAELGDPLRLMGALIHCAMLAVTVIVMAVPEGLPMMITVVLSANMKRMLRDHVLVRKLFGIETAGSLNILFTDKTGTLTGGKLSVSALVGGDGNPYTLEELRKRPGLWRHFHACMGLNNAASMTQAGLERKAVGGNATDRALLEALEDGPEGFSGLRVLRRTPFDSARKFSCAQVAGALRATLYKGAPELLLPKCTSLVDAGGREMPLTEAHLRTLRERAAALSKKAVRLIALSYATEPAGDALPESMVLVGLVGLRDQIRPEAAQGVREAQGAGIQLVMITGDSLDTACAIARETGILRGEGDVALSSQELAALDEEALRALLPRLRVVARALPGDKSRLVRAAQSLGLVTGMTGDGVNDAPALTMADVGFAMGSGTEVAKEAADIVILDDNLSSIGKAVLYGRTIFKSIRKFIIFQLTVNLCAVSLAILGPLMGIETPITVLQMLWINMVMDTLAGLAFSGEAPEQETMRESPKRRDEAILSREMLGRIVFGGVYTVGLCLFFLTNAVPLGIVRDLPGDAGLLTGFFGLFMFLAIGNAFNARADHPNLFKGLGRSGLFLAVMGLVAAVQLAILYVGGPLFRTSPLESGELLSILALAATVIPADLLRRRLTYTWESRKKDGVHLAGKAAFMYAREKKI